MDDSDGVSTLGFPSLPASPGFVETVRAIFRSQLAPLFDSSPMLPGWYPPSPPDNAQDMLRLSLSLSPIDCVPSGASWSACLPLLWWRPTILIWTQDCCQHFSRSSVIRFGASYLRVVGFLLLQCGRQFGRAHSDRLSETCSALAIGSGGPVLVGIPPSSVTGFGHGCAFRSTTYRASDYAQPSGKYGLPLHHPRFLEWIGAPELARLLDKGPSAWLRSLSHEKAIDAARQLHRGVCLMTTNLNILHQYVLCLQGAASKILELTLGSRDFPSAAVAAGAMAPRASVHMEAMGFLRH